MISISELRYSHLYLKWISCLSDTYTAVNHVEISEFLKDSVIWPGVFRMSAGGSYFYIYRVKEIALNCLIQTVSFESRVLVYQMSCLCVYINACVCMYML